MVFIRFEVEICESLQSTREEILKKIPGFFGIFCCPSIMINEEVMKAAGKKFTISQQNVLIGKVSFNIPNWNAYIKYVFHFTIKNLY